MKEFFTNLYQFLIIDIGEDLLSFLRNLTPIILMLSISIFVFHKYNQFDIVNADWGMTFLGFSALFVSIIAMLANVVIFAKKSLFAIHQLDKYEKIEDKDKRLTFYEAIYFLWTEGAARQIVFFYVVILLSLSVVIISATVAAFNLAKNLSG